MYIFIFKSCDANHLKVKIARAGKIGFSCRSRDTDATDTLNLPATDLCICNADVLNLPPQ